MTSPRSDSRSRICLCAALMSSDSPDQEEPQSDVWSVDLTSSTVGKIIVSGRRHCWLTPQHDESNTRRSLRPEACTTLSLPTAHCGQRCCASERPPGISSIQPCCSSSSIKDQVNCGSSLAPAQLESKDWSCSDGSSFCDFFGQMWLGGIGSKTPVGTPCWRCKWRSTSGSCVNVAKACRMWSRKCWCTGTTNPTGGLVAKPIGGRSVS